MAEEIATSSLRLAWSRAPWDEPVYGFPVVQITAIEVLGPDADADLGAFEKMRDRLGAGLVSCRLPHERLKESMLLEDHGFRFVEMLYQPELDLRAAPVEAGTAPGLAVVPATDDDLPALLEMAGSAFVNERFKVDPRLDPALSDRRYQGWVASSLRHEKQSLHVLRDGERRVAFFVTELLDDGTCYWHLNAVAPGVQGQGYGRRAWLAMLDLARAQGARRVRTTIVARNHRVLNLYARLGFRFPAPLMTFHWVRPSVPLDGGRP